MLGAGAIFLILLIIGIAASNRLMVTSALVGVAGSFVGYQLALLIGVAGSAALLVAVIGALAVLWIWRMLR